MSTTTEAEYTGEENTGDTATVVPVEDPETHPLGEHLHPDGSVHQGYGPACSGGCIKKENP